MQCQSSVENARRQTEWSLSPISPVTLLSQAIYNQRLAGNQGPAVGSPVATPSYRVTATRSFRQVASGTCCLTLKENEYFEANHDCNARIHRNVCVWKSKSCRSRSIFATSSRGPQQCRGVYEPAIRAVAQRHPFHQEAGYRCESDAHG